MNNLTHPSLQGLSFTTLFAFGEGDVSNRDHHSDVTMTNVSRHFFKCATCDNAKRMCACLFAADERLMHWAQNTSDTHRVNGQKNVGLRKNPEYDHLNEENLRKMLLPGSEGNEKFQKLLNRMQTCNFNIAERNASFYRKRIELESFIEHKGMHTLWLTLSAAGNHWLDWDKIIYGD